VSILAPKPFINCLYKECNLTFNGKISSETSRAATRDQEKYTLRFNGVVFPHQFRKVCQRIQAVGQTQNEHLIKVAVIAETEQRSEPFSYKGVIRKVNLDDNFRQYRIIID